jgi:hypothetical protein
MMDAEGFSALKPSERTDIKDITHLTIRVSFDWVYWCHSQSTVTRELNTRALRRS